VVLIFLIPGVQTYTAQKITRSINDNYGTQINIERLRIGLNADIEINEIQVFDLHNDTIFDINSLSTSVFNLTKLFNKGNLNLSNTDIEGLKMKLIRYKGKDSDNLTHFLNKFESQKPKDTASSFNLHIDDVFLIDSEFSVIDYNLENPEAFSIKNLNFDLNNINIVDEKVSLNINSLSGLTGYGLKIDRLQSQFFMDGSEMRLNQLKIETPQSNIATHLKFQYQSGDWSDFENKVLISAEFNRSELSTTDLNHFYKGFGLSENLELSGQLKGTINNFSFKNLKIDGLQRSQISGDMLFENITKSNNFKVKTQNIDITTNYFDLKNLLPEVLGDNLPKFMQYMGNFSVVGQTQILGQNLEAEFNLKSSVGEGLIKVDFKDLDLAEEVTYKGFLNLKKVNLAKLMQSKNLGISSFDLYVNGKGFTEQSLDTKIDGKIQAFEYNNYIYNNISVDGNLKYPIFNGKLNSKDPNFLFDFEGVVNASKAQNRYNFKSNVAYADLYQLNFVEKDSVSVFKGNLDIDMRANSIDDAVGQIKFNDFNYQTSINTYSFKDFVLTSEIKNGLHNISVNSPDVIDGKLYGDFRPSQLPEFVEASFRNLYFKNVVKSNFKNKNLNFEFKINNKIVEAIFPDISIAPQTFINGKISSNQDEMKLRFISPKIRYKDNTFDKVEIQIDKQNPFFDTYIQVSDIQNSTYPISNFSLINVKLNDTLFFRTEFAGGKQQEDKFNLSLYQTYDDKNNTVFGFQNSDVLFKNKSWHVNKNNNYQNNRVILEPGLQNFTFDSIAFSHNDQMIKLDGVMRDSTYKDINLKLKSIELNNITPYIDSLKLNGLVNGDIRLYQKKGKYAPNLNVMVRDFKVNDLLYGDLKLSADGNENLSDFDLKAYLSKDQQNFLAAKGFIKTEEDKQSIDLDIDFNDLDISSLSPLGSDIISRIRGKLDGSAKLVGAISNPDFSGELFLSDAGLKFPYLNIDFDFQDNARIILNQKSFEFDNILLTDTKYKTQGTLSGFISHEQFKNWNLDLNLSSDNILSLDTAYSEESLYYGTAFISGDASISGPTDALKINVDAISQPNTVFNIPLSDTETIGDNSFIYFLSPEDKKNKAQGKNYSFEEVSGLSLTFDLKITNDALVEVVVDQESGSSLRGRGNGSLLIEINTNGKFDMYGDFVALSGEYIYKYQGLIEKKFKVIPGGYLSWEGNPVDANMDIQAKYTTNANPAVLLDNPSINREIPIDVIISLSGELMQPDIGFDLQYPNLSSVVESELNYRIQGRENIERQALSLVVQGTFYNNEGVGMNAIGSNLLAERATSILDQILKDDEGKFNIGIDYVQADRTPNQNAVVGSDRVGMTLQTQLSERIFINGRFGVPVGGQTQSFVFGDVEINFLLNETGSLRAQMFNRESNIQFIGEELGYTQGFGILYSVDFETFGELFRRMLNRNKKAEKKTKPTPNETDSSNKSLVPKYIKFPNKQ